MAQTVSNREKIRQAEERRREVEERAREARKRYAKLKTLRPALPIRQQVSPGGNIIFGGDVEMKAELKEDTFQEQVRAAQDRLEGLRQRAGILPTQQELLPETLEELSIALAELEVALEELRQTNDELAGSRQIVEAERQRYQELFDFAPDGYVVTDAYGTIVEANHAAMILFNLREDFLVGRPLALFVAHEDKGKFRELLTRLENGEDAQVWEGHIHPRYGRSPFSSVMTVSTTRDVPGRLVGLRWLIRDITERKRAEEALREAHDELGRKVEERTLELVNINEVLKTEIAERKQIEEKLRESERQLQRVAKELEQQLIVSDRLVSLGELSASLAHEFNNPLQIILGFAEDLLREMEPSDPDYQPLAIIAQETERCRKIVQDLRDFARPTVAELRLTDLNDVLYHSIGLVSGHLRKASVQIKTEIQPDLPMINVDPQQLAQVLMNLFFNAAEAMPEGGTLTVRLTTNSADPANKPEDNRASAHEVIIAVADTGTGITPDNLSMIFHPFFTTKKKKGMGLGLSICDRIVKAHRGRIRVESTVGKGTTFYLYLPVEA